jgi:eukaryotic-like serine/threonine-protein kinase
MADKDSTEPSERRPWFFWFTIIAGLMFIGFGVFVAWMIFKYQKLDQYGYTTVAGPRGVVVEAVDPGGPAAGKLEPGDKILAINGDTRFSRITHFYWRSSFLEGGNLSLRIERNGVEREAALSNDKYPASQATIDSRFDRDIAYLPRYLASLIVALMIGLLKPADKRARLVAYAFLMISHQAIAYPIIPLRGMFNPAEDRIAYFIMLILGGIWFGPVAFHTAYRFLEGIPEGRLWTVLQRVLYSTGAALFLNRVVLTTVTQTGVAIEFRSDYYQVERLFGRLENWYWPLCMVAISAVLIRNSLVVRQADQRRRVRLVLYGSLASLLPQTAVTTISRIAIAAGYESVANGGVFDTLRLIAAIALILAPISWGYAILNRQVYDIQVVIRRSVQYLLAKNALRLFLALPAVGVLYVVVTKSDRSLRELIVYLFYDNPYYLLLTIAAVIGLIYRGRLRDWIDRRFFREAYQQDKILRELGEEVRGLDSMSEMSRLVSQKVDEALHPERLYIFYREEDNRDLSLSYSTGGSGEKLRIPEEYELLRVMEHHGAAIDFPFPQKIKAPRQETDWLSSMGTSLIVPLNGIEQRLTGLLLLGPKKSEAPYSGSDRQLLDSLANQIAVVYENIRLKERVASERKIQREVLARVEERRINLLKECPRCGRCYDSSEKTCPDDRSELRLSLPIERTVEGRYRLDRLIGKGGMGAVYEASDVRLNRSVAVKILSGGLFGKPDALRRFQREARASARLSHANIVTVYDYGALSAEGAYLVMELLKGKTLGDILKDRGYLEPDVAADWFDQVFSAMEAAHEAGVIHRDLKPDNIFIAEEPDKTTGAESAQPVVKILDFGIAKMTRFDASAEDTTHSVTEPGTLLGTFGFISPEQLTGGEVDQRSDIFSLGAVVVRALTGRRPFPGKTYQELITAMLSRPFHLPGKEPAMRRLDAVLQRCLAIEKENRFASVAEMRRELIPAIRQTIPPRSDSAQALDQDWGVTQKFDI